MRHKTFIIAEAGVNHNGDVNLAEKLIDKAKMVGADAVKFQTFLPEENYSPYYVSREHIIRAMALALNRRDFERIFRHCARRKIMFISTPFDLPSVEMLHEIGVSAFKIASTEICNIPLLKSVARKGKPIILSTGMAMKKEIETGLDTIRSNWRGSRIANRIFPGNICLLYCVSLYPAPYDKVDLRKIVRMADIFNVAVGFSDHSLGIELAVAAAALGAAVIEKHIKLSKDFKCPDGNISLCPEDFKEMVDAIRRVNRALGNGDLILASEEMAARKKLRKGLIASRDMKKGYVLKEEDIILQKPMGDFGPERYFDLIERTLKKDIGMGELFTASHFTTGGR